MRWLGQVRTVALAALLNAVVGTTLLLWQFLKRQRESTLMENPRPRRQFATRPTTISLPTASIVSFVAGFVALGFEIVWYRLFHFTTAGVAKSFAFLLGTYLAGIAAGSMLANRFCKEIVDPRTSIRFLAAAMFGANLLSFLAGPILFSLVTRISYLWVLIPIGFAASCLGIIFPMLCHVSIAADESAGPQTSYIYLSNIAGSAFGSYFTGFVLMDALPLRHVSVVLTLVGLLLAITLLLWTKSGTKWLILSASAALAAVLFVVQFSAPLFQDMYDKMLWKALYPTMGPTSPQKIAAVIETRSGIINVTRDGTVFGNGAYDGHLNLSLTNDTNGISRLFTLSYFHPDPKEVLMIGLSSGSWAQVMANHPQLAHLTIVEINPGYLPLIANRDEVASLLNNPKVHIDIDDGRRWLIRHPERKYDAIVMNTTFNWRSNISNLLSVEFLQLIREHLKPGGVEFYNTTFSDEAMATGLKVFPYGMRVAGFLAVSDSPLQLNAQRWSSVLEQYRIDGKPLFDLPREQSLLEAILLRYRLDGTRVFDVPRDPVRFKEVQSIFATFDHKLPGFFTLESAESMRRRMADVRLITDDNMGTEWQH
jgi:spermidine synthase